ncbi:MAG: hypothetical protein LBP99_02185 [Azoarcus sp.]|jgi:hypothetical protein|nr:hypothetical protein [Azoarcus sp.]
MRELFSINDPGSVVCGMNAKITPISAQAVPVRYLSVVIPVRNEAGNIRPLVEEIRVAPVGALSVVISGSKAARQ